VNGCQKQLTEEKDDGSYGDLEDTALTEVSMTPIIGEIADQMSSSKFRYEFWLLFKR
jgi:hypothetical protein